MRYFNYAFSAIIPGEGNVGRRLNSLLRVKLGVQSEDGYESTIANGRGYMKLYGDSFKIDLIRSGKDWEKYFAVSEVSDKGMIEITITIKSQYDYSFTREGESNSEK
jgi:hypothetical protein